MREAVTGAVGAGGAPAEALIAIKDQPGCTAEWLVGVLKLSQPGVAHVVRRLGEAGWIERRPGPDGRSRGLHLSPAGREVAARVLTAREDVLVDMVEDLSVAERDHLRAVADRLLRPSARTDRDLGRLCRLCDRSRCAPCPVHEGYLTACDERPAGDEHVGPVTHLPEG
ncbi:winged helix-turn-helix transcriptional regulator [Pseudonocardia sp. S2-4]|uniref:Winged helix-turn-helix transcriptional regulator n=2 Tax=Pseudonocardia humida TaxID=2800819 RepID=A0ABT1A7Q8_9PSEU|nr:winged helix-turn-helix transcriptional regulator [Pseudonocardia humida]